MLEKVKLFAINFFPKLRKTRLENSSTVPQKIKRSVLILALSTENQEQLSLPP